MSAFTPPRCRVCPDGFAELADVSVGDAWLERFTADPSMADGVSDLIARTELGDRLLGSLEPDWLTLLPTTPEELLATQTETHRIKRRVLRGRRWLRRLAGRRLPDYPGLDLEPGLTDAAAGIRDLAEETLFRALGTVRHS
jgi:coenzyme F420 hydrogenase subunit beta